MTAKLRVFVSSARVSLPRCPNHVRRPPLASHALGCRKYCFACWLRLTSEVAQ